MCNFALVKSKTIEYTICTICIWSEHSHKLCNANYVYAIYEISHQNKTYVLTQVRFWCEIYVLPNLGLGCSSWSHSLSAQSYCTRKSFVLKNSFCTCHHSTNCDKIKENESQSHVEDFQIWDLYATDTVYNITMSICYILMQTLVSVNTRSLLQGELAAGYHFIVLNFLGPRIS